MNGYFMTNAERIRNDPKHVVLHVPKEGPASAEMDSWHKWVCPILGGAKWVPSPPLEELEIAGQ